MIPLRLHLKNFLSYGSTLQTINFEPYHLICLSGKNGHGKSALLDALTWALWGQARKTMATAKADAHLLRLGQSSMMVALDFACNGITYRVRREYCYDRTKAVSHLDFGIRDSDSGKLRQLTKKTMRETQELIIATIGLDCAAFESSAFLRQGHSDEFSRKSAKDRKEVIANILGLGTYELLRKKSIDRGRIALAQQHNSVRTCELLTHEVTIHDETEAKLVIIQKNYVDTMEQAREQEVLYEICISEKKSLLDRHNKIQNLVTHAEQTDIKIGEQKTLLHQTWTTWRQIKRQTYHLLQEPFPHRTREELMVGLTALQKKLHDQLTLTTVISVSKQKLHTHTTLLERTYLQEAKVLEDALQVLNQRSMLAIHDHRATEKMRQELSAHYQALSAEHEREEKKQNIIEILITTLHEHEASLNRVRSKLQRALQHHQRLMHHQKRIELEIAQFSQHEELQCHACLQSIKQEQVQHIIDQHQSHKARLQHQAQRLLKVTKAYQKTLETLHEITETIRQQIGEIAQRRAYRELRIKQLRDSAITDDTLQQKLATLTLQMQEIQHDTIVQTAQIEALKAEHLSMLNGDSRRNELIRTIATAEEELAAAAHDQIAYQTLQRELEALIVHDEKRAACMREMSQQQERATRIHELCQSIKSLRQEDQRAFQHRAELEHITTQLRQIELQEQAIRAAQLAIHKNKEGLAAERGALEQTLRHIAHKQNLLTQEHTALRLFEERASDYATLAQVLSKDGIQGMLIEHVLPEIEYEANLLLSKLTDNQAHLKFESLRELKNGGFKETLEIKISDALGIRPYELFSGGEAFRIDFALRLAISKLLARRAGASVQTLIIDEGFGSQDEEGLNHIMESLYAIQSEFAKIIIVSHLPSMKDQFPVHFHVQKSSQGSTVQIIEQG